MRLLESLLLAFHFTCQEHFCCGRNFGISGCRSSPAHWKSEIQQSPLLVSCPSAGVRWREKQDQPQWEAGPVPGVFAPCCTGGLWGVESHSCCSQGLEPLWSTERGFAPEQARNQHRTESGQKKYIVIVCVPVVGCRSQLSQLWHTDIPERLEISQECNCQPPDQHLSEQNLVTSVWEQKYLPNAEVRRKIWSQFPVSAQEKQLGWAPLP